MSTAETDDGAVGRGPATPATPSTPSTGSSPAVAPRAAGPSGSVEASPDEPGVVVLRGEVDASVVAGVPDELVASGVRVADVTDVTFIDSGGIHLLLRLHRAAPEGLDLRGAPEDGLVLAVLATLGLGGLFGRA
jgi:ABC-type transporter Mla MlaB component